MKYTRVEIKSRFKKYRGAICFTILIPFFALVIGKVLMNYSDKEATSIAVKMNDFKNVYFLQLGVYRMEEGAKEKVKLLEEKGINAILLKDETYYKVIYKIASSPKKLEEEKKAIESKEIDVYIKDFQIEGLENVKEGNIKEYTTYVKEFILAAIDKKESVVKYSYDYAKKAKVLEGENKKIQENINRLMKEHIENNLREEDNIKEILEIIINYNKMV